MKSKTNIKTQSNQEINYISGHDSNEERKIEKERNLIIENNFLFRLKTKQEKEDLHEKKYDEYVRSVLDDHPAKSIPNYANYGDFRDESVKKRSLEKKRIEAEKRKERMETEKKNKKGKNKSPQPQPQK